jgi:hypothetical protein
LALAAAEHAASAESAGVPPWAARGAVPATSAIAAIITIEFLLISASGCAWV